MKVTKLYQLQLGPQERKRAADELQALLAEEQRRRAGIEGGISVEQVYPALLALQEALSTE